MKLRVTLPGKPDQGLGSQPWDDIYECDMWQIAPSGALMLFKERKLPRDPRTKEYEAFVAFNRDMWLKAELEDEPWIKGTD